MQTTDNLDEIFDIVDINDTVVGQRTRRECNTNPGLIHRAAFVLVYNDRNQILWQKRSETKDVGAGQWVTSVSGHVSAGEEYEKTALREMQEELGIELPVEFLGKFLFRYSNENEYSAIYRAYSEGPFHYNRQEISTVEFMIVEDLIKKEKEGMLTVSKAAHYVIEALSLA